jgi:phosphoserine phosphatase
VVRYVPDLISVMRRYYRGEMHAEDFLRVYAPMLRDYFARKKPDLIPLVTKFWDKHEKGIKPFYRRIQRSDDVIITASPTFIMEDICKRIGVKHLIATDFDIKTGEVRSACYRESKVDLFRAAFPGSEIDDFYTDSVNDEFLFPLAKRVFLVKKHEIRQIK